MEGRVEFMVCRMNSMTCVWSAEISVPGMAVFLPPLCFGNCFHTFLSLKKLFIHLFMYLFFVFHLCLVWYEVEVSQKMNFFKTINKGDNFCFSPKRPRYITSSQWVLHCSPAAMQVNDCTGEEMVHCICCVSASCWLESSSLAWSDNLSFWEKQKLLVLFVIIYYQSFLFFNLAFLFIHHNDQSYKPLYYSSCKQSSW